jgi:hypothetical protein
VALPHPAGGGGGLTLYAIAIVKALTLCAIVSFYALCCLWRAWRHGRGREEGEGLRCG